MSQRDPQDGRPLDCYVVSEGGFYQYQHPPFDWSGEGKIPPLEECVPPCSVFSSRGRWFSEERAEALLALEHSQIGATA